MTSPSALVFDFDGLLIDTETATLRAWQDEFEARGTPLPSELWHTVAGMRGSRATLLAHLHQRLGPFDDDDVLKSWRARLDASLVNEDLRDGVRTYLDTAKALGIRLAVASSASGDWVCGHLERVGVLEFFDAVTCGHDHPPKPKPDVYLATVAALDVNPARAIAFEDSPPGVIAAKAAGLYCVAVPNPATATLSFDRADRVITSFAAEPIWDLVG